MLTSEQVVGMLRYDLKVHDSQKDLANTIGVSQAYLSDVLAGNREPSGPILKYLELERVVRYRKRRKNGSQHKAG